MRALFSRRFPDVNKIIFSKRAFSGETDFVDKFILFQDSDKDRQRPRIRRPGSHAIVTCRPSTGRFRHLVPPESPRSFFILFLFERGSFLSLLSYCFFCLLAQPVLTSHTIRGGWYNNDSHAEKRDITFSGIPLNFTRSARV